MRKASLVIIVVVAIFSCNNMQAQTAVVPPLPLKQFTTDYLNFLVKRFPSTSFQMQDDSTISVLINKKYATLAVDNAYNQYQLGASENELFERYSSVLKKILNPDAIKADKIIPIIKPVAYLQLDKTLVYEPYNEDIVITYAADDEQAIQFLRQENFEKLNINRDSLLLIAKKNIRYILDSAIIDNEDPDYSMVAVDGTFELSLILFPEFWTDKRFKVKGSYIIAIPNRDALFVCDSKNKVGIAKIKEMTAISFSNRAYPVSKNLYKWNGKRFEKFEGK